MTETPERTALYRIWGEADLLLYIGVSKNFGQRWKQHAKEQPWWDEMKRLTADEWFEYRSEAEEAEEAAIKAERPQYNKRHLVPVARKQRGTAQPVPVITALPPSPEPPTLEETVPFPYSLLSFRLPEPDMSDADLSTPDGRLRAAETFNAYEREARKVRSTLEAHAALLRGMEYDRFIPWAAPTLRRMRKRIESLIGDGTHLAAGREASLRIARILREDGILLGKITGAIEVIADTVSAIDAIDKARGEPSEGEAA